MKLTIPYYLHKVGAGFPSPATDYIEDDIDLNSHLITNAPATFIIRVQGKSMVDVGINDGDLLVVDKSLKPKNFFFFNKTNIFVITGFYFVPIFVPSQNCKFFSIKNL